jgi:hypothetical protein
LHGGELSIRSRLGEGTQVTVRLPIDCERARPRPKSFAPAKVPATDCVHSLATSRAAAIVDSSKRIGGGSDVALRSELPVKKSA